MATKEYPAGKRGLAPSHPGIIWRDIIKDGLGINFSEAAERMGVSRPHLQRVLGGANSVTPNLALRFARLCGKDEESAKLWLRIQIDFDLWHARLKLKDDIKRIKPLRPKLEVVD